MENKIVYKYCKVDVLKKILINHRMRMNDVFSFNDKNELYMMKNIVISFVDRFVNKHKSDNNIKCFEKNVVIAIENWIDDMPYKFFVLCFSQEKDSELMFSRYTKDEGVSIGVDYNKICFTNNRDVLSGFVHYIEEDVNKMSNELLLDIENYISNTFNRYKKKINDNESPVGLFDDFGKVLFKNSIFFKSNWWKDEKEYRLMQWCCYKKNYDKEILGNELKYPNEKYENIELIMPNNVCLMCSENFYMDLDFSKDNDFIKEIILGPKCNLDKDFVERLLHDFHYENVEVSVSKGKVR